MKTYFREFTSPERANEFAQRRANLGHNVRLYPVVRVYFSAGAVDIAGAVEATPEMSDTKS